MAARTNGNTSAILLFVGFLLGTSFCGATHLSIITSYAEEVPKFSTAIIFRIQLKSSGGRENATISFDRCCWDIEEGDRDCQIMVLRPAAVTHQFKPEDVKFATFMHYNLYPRYRQGECHFTVRTQGEGRSTWHHTLSFNTIPKTNNTVNPASSQPTCEGRDQDADRSCTPVDCAVKYGGRRNYYSNSTGRCELVTPCNTRGEDGISVVAYYDRETNICHRLGWMDDNMIDQVESDLEIPTTINASRADYYPGFEPDKMSAEHVTLDCNHGRQSGIYCTCDEGWQSSGLDPQFPTIYNWCDQKTVMPKYALHHNRQPRHFQRAYELIIILVLTVFNVTLTTVWIFLFVGFLFLTNATWDRASPIASVICSPINFCSLHCYSKRKNHSLVSVDSSEE